MNLSAFLHEDRALYPITFLGLRALLALHWLGTDEASLRLPFALVGIVSVPIMALAGRRLIGPWPALLAAAFVVLDPWHQYWSQNARGYILVFTFAAVAANRVHAYLGSLRTRDLVLAFGSLGFGTLCHSTEALQAAGLAVFFGLRWLPKPNRGTWVRLAIGALVGCILLPLLVARFSFFQDFLQAKNDPSIQHFAQTTAFYFRPLMLLMAAIGLWFAHSTLGRDRTLLLGCLWLVPFFVLLTIGGQLVKVTARYAICSLPIVMWLAAFACAQLAQAILQSGRGWRWERISAAALLPLLLAADSGSQLIAYYTVQHGQRARWREACEFATQYAGASGLRVLTINGPTVLYYLRPLHWSVGLANPYPSIRVVTLTKWGIRGLDEDQVGRPEKDQVRVHEPGGENHLAWNLREARSSGSAFVVMVTLPELEEQDHVDHSVRRTLERDYQLVLHLPCWVGPKDESIYIYVPKAA